MPEAITTEPFDLNQANNFVRLELKGATTATVQVSLLSDSTPSAFVLTVQRSNDGENWCALESATTIAFGAFSASVTSAMTAAINCAAFKYIGVRLTTVESAALTGKIHIYAQRVAGG